MYTSILDNDSDARKEADKNLIGQESAALSANAAGSSHANVRNAMAKHHDLLPVIDNNQPSLLAMNVPMSEKLKKSSKQYYNPKELTYDVEVWDPTTREKSIVPMNYAYALKHAKSVEKYWSDQGKNIKETRPELYGLIQIANSNKDVGLRPEKETLTYAVRDGNQYVDLTTETYAANAKDAVNKVTRTYGGSMATKRDLGYKWYVDNQGNTYKDEAEAEKAAGAGNYVVEDAYIEEVIRTPNVSSVYNINDEEQRSLADEPYSAGTTQLNMGSPAGMSGANTNPSVQGTGGNFAVISSAITEQE
jgi:hypothetical protein